MAVKQVMMKMIMTYVCRCEGGELSKLNSSQSHPEKSTDKHKFENKFAEGSNLWPAIGSWGRRHRQMAVAARLEKEARRSVRSIDVTASQRL